MATDWYSDVSFMDRLGYVTTITGAYKSAHPNVDSVEASRAAKQLEQEAHRAATSASEYHLLCNTALETLRGTGNADIVENLEAEDTVVASNAPTKAFGRYHHATHYKDSLHSDIFRAVVPSDVPPDFTGKPGTAVALKVTYMNAMAPPHNSEREIRILKKAVFPQIIPLWESFSEAAGHLVLVFPFMPYDLDALLQQQYLPEARRRSILKDLFSALQYLHSLGIIHRDVKPANILMRTPSGHAYLGDFGVAWCPGDKDSEPADTKITDVGTSSYRAPELLFGGVSYGCSLDLWAAGCVAAQVVTSSTEPLFEPGEPGSDLQLIHSIFVKLGTPNYEVWPELQSFPDWSKMLWKEYPPKPWSELLPETSDAGRDLVSGLVRYQSTERLEAGKVLEHAYLAG
ncbi:cell division protein kinase [Trichodelitschia bisporula]|uniref:cyclin-dependent kinase n=1 Tax=Trichodelitschia bisporula TaxID=703511 RepID=A0A6G1I295_9PEZI|nr:cell division protein kinase [Trichodelitschia bisporula]